MYFPIERFFGSARMIGSSESVISLYIMDSTSILSDVISPRARSCVYGFIKDDFRMVSPENL